MEIKNDVSNEIVIKKSRFITKLFKIETIEDTTSILEHLKKEYPDASHICYAYILNDVNKKYSDDKEPTGTAGISMLSILEKNNIDNTLAVTIRYFGGVELGTGGLFRAYAKGVKEALNIAELVVPDNSTQLTLRSSYNDLKLLEASCGRYPIINKNFSSSIFFTITIPIDEVEDFKMKLDTDHISIMENKKD